MKKIKTVHIYFLILFMLVLGYFVENPLKKIGFYEQVNKYFGITQLPIFSFLLLYGLIFFKKDKIKRTVAEIKLWFLLVILILMLFVYIFYLSGLNIFSYENLKTIVLDDNYFKNLIKISMYDFNMGYVFSYILYLIASLNFKFYQIFLTIVGIQFVLLFLIIYSPIKNYIKRNVKAYREKKKREREEKLLREQIKIKEALEKNETLKKVKFRENKEKVLKEKVEVFKKVQLTKMVNLNEEMGEDK